MYYSCCYYYDVHVLTVPMTFCSLRYTVSQCVVLWMELRIPYFRSEQYLVSKLNKP